MPKLSIITVNLNNAAGLERTIQSVVGQTFKDYEYLVIDGTSRDDSVDTIQRHAAHIDRWVIEKDSGVFHAMNKGIALAKGDYCLFLNSGDELLGSDILDRVFAKVAGTEYDLLFGDKMTVEDGVLVRDSEFPETLDIPFFLGRSICHQASFIKRDLFTRFGMYDEDLRIVSDWKFFLQIFLFGKIAEKNIHEITVKYDSGGISSTNESLRLAERKQVLTELVPTKVMSLCDDYRELAHRYKALTSNRTFNVISGLRRLMGRS
jgi:glycosyltransferase involved in cell wall biosynthesis